MPSFIYDIHMTPDFTVQCCLQETVKEFQSVTKTARQPPYLVYDTTFNCGDFYVSILAFRHTAFKNAPTIPMACLIHDRKKGGAHDSFFRLFTERNPFLNNDGIIIVTDRESAFSNSISKYMHNGKHFNCWNHIKRDVKYWLKDKKIPP